MESVNYHRILLEQGMAEDEVMDILAARSRDNSRTPMQWDGSENAGFTSGIPWIGLSCKRREANARAEEDDSLSVLSYYRRLIRLRKENEAVSEGSVRFILPDEPGIIAYERTYKNSTLTVLCNFTGESRTVPFSGGAFVLGSYECPPEAGDSTVTLRPYEGCVYSSSSVSTPK